MNRWWAIAKWMIKGSIALWFVALPLMPLYGWLRPWPDAEFALRAEGVSGVLLMVGGGSSAQHSYSADGHVWREEVQRSFVAFPESIRGASLFGYFEVRGSGIDGTKKGVTRTPMLLPLLAMWIGAGLFTLRTIRRQRKKEPNQSLEPTTLLGTSAAEQPLVPSRVVAHL